MIITSPLSNFCRSSSPLFIAHRLISLASFVSTPPSHPIKYPHVRRISVTSRKNEEELPQPSTDNSSSISPTSDLSSSIPLSSEPLKAGLYVVATPIGSLEDITLRALRILRSADKILCEDTRRTGILLNHYGIKASMESYHLHNERTKLTKVINELRNGAALALCSDAGVPLINDPGSLLIAAAVEEGINVVPVPGPSATLTALVGAGLNTSSFTFCGFVEAKTGARIKQFDKWKNLDSTLIFFVSPHALIDALEDACTVFSDQRRCCLARELTKTHEEFWRSTLKEALDEFKERGPRGEFTLVIEGGSAEEAAELTDDDILKALKRAVEEGSSASQAAREVAADFNINKKRVYNLSLKLK